MLFTTTTTTTFDSLIRHTPRVPQQHGTLNLTLKIFLLFFFSCSGRVTLDFAKKKIFRRFKWKQQNLAHDHALQPGHIAFFGRDFEISVDDAVLAR